MTRKFKQTKIGKIPEDWENKSLGDCIEFVYGEGLPKRKRTDGNIPVYGSNGQIDWHNASLVNGPGIIIGRKGSVGEVTFSKRDFWPIDTTYYVKTKSDNDLLFWFYFLKTLNLPQMNSHSAVPGLNRELVYEILRSIPPLPTQRAIAKILSDLDEKIELNRQMNKTLESIAQAIFKHWFVDFEFPVDLQNHSSSSHFLSHWERKEVRGVSSMKGYKSSGGKMVDSELGEIPEGWRVGRLGEMIVNYDSKRIPLSKRERQKRKGKYPYYGASSIMDYVDDYIFDGIHVLMAEDGSVIDDDGLPILQYVWGKFWVNNHTHVLQGKDGVPTEFVLLLLQHTNVQHIVTGAVQPKINQNNMNRLEIVIPPKKQILSFNNIIYPIYDNYQNTFEESKTLSTVRDSLLPKLMSGKIKTRSICE